MALWQVITKQKARANGEFIEKGMTVEVVTTVGKPLSSPEGKDKIAAAFMSKYGVDMKKAHWLSSVYLDVVQLNK